MNPAFQETRTAIPLAEAEVMASKICARLKPYCMRIAVAGSIRRKMPFVNDIDIVCEPLAGIGRLASLYARIKEKSHVVSHGPQTMITRLANGVQLDIWFAKGREADLVRTVPSNWGTLLLCRTGSKEFNIWLARQAQLMEFHWNPHQGLYLTPNGTPVSETEEEIFAALGLDFIQPEHRNGNPKSGETQISRISTNSISAPDGGPGEPATGCTVLPQETKRRNPSSQIGAQITDAPAVSALQSSTSPLPAGGDASSSPAVFKPDWEGLKASL